MKLVSGGTSTIDVLDRVIDKGIVIDAWALMSLGSIDLLRVDVHIVVASIETYLQYGEVLRHPRHPQSPGKPTK
jgi:hypothetical protein